MYYVYYEHVSSGKQEYCGQYETMKEAVKRVALLYARHPNGEYYYFIKEEALREAESMSGYLVRDEDERRECCGNCKHHLYEREKADWYCSNDTSDNYAEWTNFECHCEEWEERE